MNKIAASLMFMVAVEQCAAWQNVAELESAAIVAFSNATVLTGTSFTNQVYKALSSDSAELRISAAPVSSAVHDQLFKDEANRQWLDKSFALLTNALDSSSSCTNYSNFWMTRFLLAGNYAARMDYESSSSICTNLIAMCEDGSVSVATNEFTRSIMSYYNMSGLDFSSAVKYVAGLSAAELGMGTVATNLSEQVASPYKEEILEFLD